MVISSGRNEIIKPIFLNIKDYLKDTDFSINEHLLIEVNNQKILLKDHINLYMEWSILKDITDIHINKIAKVIFYLNQKKTYFNDDGKEKKYIKDDIIVVLYQQKLFQDLKDARRQFKQSIESNYNESTIANMKFTGVLNVDNCIENVKLFFTKQPFFFDNYNIYWFWDNKEKCWKQVDEVDIINALDKELNFGGQTITSIIRKNYLLAFQHIGRENKPLDPPKTWIQFKEKIFDVSTKKIINASPKYFICNPIPYSIGEDEETPIMDKLFSDWVGDRKDTLYEIIAYCCLTDYPIHSLFCLVGSGRNGKSQYQKIIQIFFGMNNICSTELDLLLENRFESAKLFKKLICVLGETNFGVINKTSLLKKLTGGDLIGFEFKNKLPFDSNNYAKIIINSNSLPSSLDSSDGFYRRWLILIFNREFPEGKDIIDTIPSIEYNNLAKKIIRILPIILERGEIIGQGTIEDRKRNYILASNPLPIFIEKCCDKYDCFVKYGDFFNSYTEFLIKHKKRKVTQKEFNEILGEEGFFVTKTTKKIGESFENGRFIEGICLKPNWKALICARYDDYDSFSTLGQGEKNKNKESKNNISRTKGVSEKGVITGTSGINIDIEIVMNEKDILQHIDKFSLNGIISIEQIKEDLGVDDILITEMLTKGLIFQPRAGFVRRL